MHAPPARKLKGHGVRRGVAQAPEGAPKPPAGSKTACTTARQGALRVLPKARPLGDMKLGSEFTELRGSLSAEVSGPLGSAAGPRPPAPASRLPWAPGRPLPAAVPTRSYLKRLRAASGAHAARPTRAGAFAWFCHRQSVPAAGRLLFLPRVYRAGKRDGKNCCF